MTEILLNPEAKTWDDYAVASREAIFSHRYAWGESLAAAYRLPIYRLAVRRRPGAQTLSGILPLLLFAAPRREKRLISLPYTDAAGMVADDPASGRALISAALDLAAELGAVHVELRQAEQPIREMANSAGPHWSHTPHTFKVGLRRPLPASSGELWSLLPAKVRNQVRKARRCGGTITMGGLELVDAFYAVFAENMRDLGSPVHTLDLFRALLGQPTLGPRVVVISLAARPVAAAMVFRHNGTLFNPWASSLRHYRPLCPNMLLYWAMLEQAVVDGCHCFDFGRSSPHAATCRFKRQWGAEPRPLTWQLFSRDGHRWHPQEESLVDESWKGLTLADSRGQGPGRRRWISL